MNREETKQILAIFKAAYPSAYNGKTAKELTDILDLWSVMFANDPGNVVIPAVQSLIATRTVGYPPTVGEVREHIHRVSTPRDTSATEAWAMVSKAVRNGIYGYKKEWEKLPEDVQRVVGSAEQLRAWAMMDAESVETVVASNFQKAYRTEQIREKENAMLPDNVKILLSSVSNLKMIGD